MTPRHPTVLLTSTRAMVGAAEKAGVPARSVDTHLAAAGLSRERLEEPEARHRADRVLALWDGLRDAAGDPVLQLRAPTCLPFGAWGVVDYLADASRTVGDALERFARFFRLITDGATLSTGEDDAGPFLNMAGPDGAPVPPVYVDYVFAALVGRARMHMRSDQSLVGVELRRPAPEDPTPYEEFFRAPLRFGAAVDRLRLSPEEWAAPMDHADEVLARLMERHAGILADRLPEPAPEIVSNVRQAVLEGLPESPKANRVARDLFVSTRTLHRRLAAADVTFRQVVEEVRAELAKDYLSNDASLSQVAFLLGFSEQSSFNRAFRRWTGMAPGRWRRVAG